MQPKRVQAPDVISIDEIASFRHIRKLSIYQKDTPFQREAWEDDVLFRKRDDRLPLTGLNNENSLSFETRPGPTLTLDKSLDKDQSLFTGITGRTGYILMAFLLTGGIVIAILLALFLFHLRASQKQEKDSPFSV